MRCVWYFFCQCICLWNVYFGRIVMKSVDRDKIVRLVDLPNVGEAIGVQCVG